MKRKKAQLEAQLDYYTIRSPYDGVVQEHSVEEGDMAVPGKPLLTIEDRHRLQLAFDVPQQDLDAVREGLPVRFSVATAVRSASLSHLYPSLGVSRMLRAEVYLSDEQASGLQPGAYVPISLVLREQHGVTLVPAAAVIESADGAPYVFVVQKDRLKPQPVTILGDQGAEVAVAGVLPGEQVVLSTFLGWAQLSAGDAVEVVQ